MDRLALRLNHFNFDMNKIDSLIKFFGDEDNLISWLDYYPNKIIEDFLKRNKFTK